MRSVHSDLMASSKYSGAEVIRLQAKEKSCRKTNVADVDLASDKVIRLALER